MLIKKSKPTLLLMFIVLVCMGLFPVNNYRTNSFNEQAVIKELEEIAETKLVKKVNLQHLKCLATAIYHEASHEPFMGKVAVARVVMNRVAHGFGSNPCRVVYQTTKIVNLDSPKTVKKLCQFSWVCEGKTTPTKTNVKYQQAEDIARQVLEEDKWHDVIPHNVLFFHSVLVNPHWVYRRFKVLGNHIFYSK